MDGAANTRTLWHLAASSAALGQQACVGSWELIVAFSDILQAVVKNQML